VCICVYLPVMQARPALQSSRRGGRVCAPLISKLLNLPAVRRFAFATDNEPRTTNIIYIWNYQLWATAYELLTRCPTPAV
jgi:hypothetical protein